MSITPPVRRYLFLGAAVLLTVAVVVDAPPLAAAVKTRPHAPGADSTNNPLARITELTALVNRRDGALADAVDARDDVARRLAETRRAEDAALARADVLGQRAIVAKQQYRVARAELGAVAAAYYRDAGTPVVVTQLLESRSVTEFGYRQKIVENVGERQERVVRNAIRARRASDRAAREAGDEQVRLHALAESLTDEIPTRDIAVERLQSGLARARFWLARWESIGAGVGFLGNTRTASEATHCLLLRCDQVFRRESKDQKWPNRMTSHPGMLSHARH